MSGLDAALLSRIDAALAGGEPIRMDLGRGGRLHIDRPLPFLFLHLGRRREPAARNVVIANSCYLLAPNLAMARAVIDLVAAAMRERFGAFVVIDVGELERDDLASDASYLPPFEVTLSASEGVAVRAAETSMVVALEKVRAKFRTPKVARPSVAADPAARFARSRSRLDVLTLRFAPIYRIPKSDDAYPQLLERMVANIVDAGLRAVASHGETTGSLAISSHRSLGRRAFIDAVRRADRALDEIASSFDFLLAVTPINARAAWEEFAAGGCKRPPQLLYRPLAIDVAQQKKKLFGIALDHFEDPVLTSLYREKQQELDLQLSLLAAREMPRFVELGRALYGPVEPSLLSAARDLLDRVKPGAARRRGTENDADVRLVKRRALAMIESYSSQYDGFSASVELRDDLPSGLMVSNGRLLISSSTSMAKGRIEALLSHEVGVHLLTYYNGSAQGLRLFRSGLAGYEGVQEGLAVLAEYLVGGMTASRMRLLAARVLGCAAMLDGAGFEECFALVKGLGLGDSATFNVVLRIYRGGGLAKDAIYLRGLLEVLAHLRAGGSLDPFWMGKIAASHFSIMQELGARGLLKPPRLLPRFLDHPGADARLKSAAAGMSPAEMVTA